MSNGVRHERLKKELGFFSVYALSTGATLSAGFFLLPGIAAQTAGAAVPLAYVIAAIPLIPATLCIVELATAMPRAGGAYYFLDRSLGPLMGTVGGFGTWFALILKTAFALVGMGAYLSLFFDLDVRWLAVVLAILFGMINLAGPKGAGKFQLLLVSALLTFLAIFGYGINNVNWSQFDGFLDRGWNSIFETAGLVYISYVGLTKVASLSEEIKDPEKNLPRSVFFSLFTAATIFSIGTVIMVGVLGVDRLTDQSSKMYYAPVAATAEVVFGEFGKVAFTGAALLAFFSVANAGIMSASRYPLAMSRDHLMSPRFAQLNQRGVPKLGIALTVALIIVLLLFFDPQNIAKLASAFQLLMFALLCFAVIAMRESKIDSYDPSFRSPLYPWMQIFGIAAPLFLISEMGWMPILFSAGMIGLATIWYFQYAKKRVNREGAIFHVFQRLGERRHEALDAELRHIMIEKGLREEDPFDDIVTRASVIDVPNMTTYDRVVELAAREFSKRVPDSWEHLSEGFKRSITMGATSIARGGALPHLRIPELEHPELVLVRSRNGVQIDHLDDFGDQHAPEEPVRAFFFLISSEDNPGQHLRILAHIAGHLESDEFMDNWIAARNDQEIKEALLRHERFVSISIGSDGPTADLVDKRVVEMRLPEGTLVAIVRRGNRTLVPRAQTTLKDGDRVTIIGDPAVIQRLFETYH